MKHVNTIKNITDMQTSVDYQLRGASRIRVDIVAHDAIDSETGEIIARAGDSVIVMTSYQTVIAKFYPASNTLSMDKNAYCYSATTNRHISEFKMFLYHMGYNTYDEIGGTQKRPKNYWIYGGNGYLSNETYNAYTRADISWAHIRDSVA